MSTSVVASRTDRRLPALTLAVFAIPVVQLVQSLVTLHRLPEFWRFYADPPYMYLFNSLSLGTGLTPQHVDHPGTSLQWLMAGVEHATFGISGAQESLAADIAWNPEKYLTATGVVLSLLFAGSVAFFLWRTLLFAGKLPAFVAGIVVLAASGLTVPWIVTATPEALVAVSTLLILGILMPVLADRSVRLDWRLLVVVGVLLAVGVTAKITILPLIVLFVFILRFRDLFVLAGVTSVSVMVILIPVYELLPRMFGWFTNLARSSGRYGGESPSSVPSNIQAGLATVTREFGLTWIILSLFVVLFVLSFRQQVAAISWTMRLPALGVAVTVLASIAVSFKESTDRDFMLLVGLVPALAALMVIWMQRLHRTARPDRTRIAQIVGLLGIAALIIAAVLANVRSFAEIGDLRERSDREVATLERASQNNGVTAHAFLAQNKYFALMLGSEWAYHPYSAEIIKRFPDNLYYNSFLSTVFGPKSDGSIGYLDCRDIGVLVERRGVVFVLPGDFTSDGDRDTPGAIALADGSTLTYDPSQVELFDDRLSSVPIDGCIPGS